ncbi:MAG: hypothetical protein ACI8W3_000858 [Myxococcota bacterium]
MQSKQALHSMIHPHFTQRLFVQRRKQKPLRPQTPRLRGPIAYYLLHSSFDLYVGVGKPVGFIAGLAIAYWFFVPTPGGL